MLNALDLLHHALIEPLALLAIVIIGLALLAILTLRRMQ